MIYTTENLKSMDISMIPADILLKIPYISGILEKYFHFTSSYVFNMVIGEGYSTGQIIPAIAQGYEYFGFMIDPMIPCLGIYFSIAFERKARLTRNLIYKNIFYIAAIMMARIAPSRNFMSAVQYMFYTVLSLIVAYLGISYFRIRNYVGMQNLSTANSYFLEN
jgi:hypothetical protein